METQKNMFCLNMYESQSQDQSKCGDQDFWMKMYPGSRIRIVMRKFRIKGTCDHPLLQMCHNIDVDFPGTVHTFQQLVILCQMMLVGFV